MKKTLFREIALIPEDNFYAAINRVTDTLKTIYPLFERRVSVMQQRPKPGELPSDMAGRLDELSELAQ